MNRGLLIFIIILIVVSILVCFYWGFYKTRQNYKLKEQQEQLFAPTTTAQADNTIINHQGIYHGKHLLKNTTVFLLKCLLLCILTYAFFFFFSSIYC